VIRFAPFPFSQIRLNFGKRDTASAAKQALRGGPGADRAFSMGADDGDAKPDVRPGFLGRPRIACLFGTLLLH
jgi:hypothetical protein